MNPCPHCYRALADGTTRCPNCYFCLAQIKRLQDKIVSQLREKPAITGYTTGSENDQDLARHLIHETSQQLAKDLDQANHSELFLAAFDELLGAGPLGPITRDPSTKLIRVKSAEDIEIKNAGGVQQAGVKFEEPEHLLDTLRRLASSYGKPLLTDSVAFTVPNCWTFNFNLNPAGEAYYLEMKADITPQESN